MYDIKDYGFVILSPDVNYGKILTTIRSIRNNCGEIPVCCVTTKDAVAKDLKQIETVCPVIRGKNHYTSLINIGIKRGHKEWNVIVVEGSIVPNGMIRKYSNFLSGIKDILFPIVPTYDIDGYPIHLNNTFYDCTLNGIMIHQKTFKEVGDISDNPMEIARVMWALDAIKKGCQFKAVLGIKI